jgi:hypothetical protein
LHWEPLQEENLREQLQDMGLQLKKEVSWGQADTELRAPTAMRVGTSPLGTFIEYKEK